MLKIANVTRLATSDEQGSACQLSEGRTAKRMNPARAIKLLGKTRRTMAALFLGVASTMLALQPAQAVSVGNDAIERDFYDGANNFGVGFGSQTIGVDGTLTSWQTYASAGTIALLVLRPTLASNLFTLIGFDDETSTGGQQTFDADINVQSGDILGAFLGTGDISFSFNTPGVNVCSGPGCDVYFSPNGGLTDLVGLLNQTIAFSGSTDRTYSLNATITPDQNVFAAASPTGQNVAVAPLPASLTLLLAGIGGLGLIARRRKRNG